MEEGSESQRLPLRSITYYEDAGTHEDLLQLWRRTQYIIKPELAFAALARQWGTPAGRFSSGLSRYWADDELYENLFEDIDLYPKKARGEAKSQKAKSNGGGGHEGVGC